MPSAVDKNPVVFGDLTGANYAAWFVSHVFFEVKFMTLFTVLFGAGIVLFTESKERKEQPALKLHYRRTILLLLIGLGHAYLLWYGDILVAYACALLAVLARNWLPRTLAAVGLALLVVPSLLYVWLGTFAHEIPAEFTAWQPTDEMIRAEIDAYRGGWIDQMEYRVPTALSFQTVGFAFTRSGVSPGSCCRNGAVQDGHPLERALQTVLPVAAGRWRGLWTRTNPRRCLVPGYHDWAFVESVFFARQFNYWGVSCWPGPTSRDHALVSPSGGRSRHRRARRGGPDRLLELPASDGTGDVHLYGHGLGLFGTLSRIELLGVVVLIWMIQVPLSVLWLRHFRFGPIEWIWRTLTYGERQPLFDRE